MLTHTITENPKSYHPHLTKPIYLNKPYADTPNYKFDTQCSNIPGLTVVILYNPNIQKPEIMTAG